MDQNQEGTFTITPSVDMPTLRSPANSRSHYMAAATRLPRDNSALLSLWHGLFGDDTG